MSTTTIGGMPAGNAANLTGAALLEMEDSLGVSVRFSAAVLRTKMFAGGTGYTAADPLTVGAIVATTGTFSDRIGVLAGVASGTAINVAPTTLSLGMLMDVTVPSSTTTNAWGHYIRVRTATGAFTLATAYGIQVDTVGPLGSGSSVTTAYALKIENQTNAATNYALFTGAGLVHFGDLVTTVASAAGSAGLRLPHGAAPTSPVNGDVWTTTAGLFVRINGATVGPLT